MIRLSALSSTVEGQGRGHDLQVAKGNLADLFLGRAWRVSATVAAGGLFLRGVWWQIRSS